MANTRCGRAVAHSRNGGRRRSIARWRARQVGSAKIERRVASRVLAGNVLRQRMRYHKAVAIHKVEADFIAETSLSSRNENVVICHGEQWYDVRALSERELEEFVADLLRAQLDELRSGLLVPH